jgi:hypothetical protein
MTYLASEQSINNGKPIELYRYKGTYQTFRYTSGQKVVSFQGPDEGAAYDYIPIAMHRSGINQVTPADDNGDVSIDLPVGTDLVPIYGFQVSPPDLELTIFRGHNPGEYIRYWNGDVENINVVSGTATLRVPSRLSAALAADFPNVYFQTPCNHTLYDAHCGIVMSAWSATTTISGIAGQVISVAGIGTLTGKLIGGDALLPSGERRMIVSQTGTDLTLNYPFSTATVGGAIVIAAGCNLDWQGDCKTRFANTARHGGFPFTPNVNIFSTGIEPGKNLVGDPCLPTCVVFDGWDYELRVRRVAGTPYWTSDNRQLQNFGLYANEPGTPIGGSGTGGAYGADWADLNFVTPADWYHGGYPNSVSPTQQSLRRMVYNPVGDAGFDARGLWHGYADIDLGESTHTWYASFRHWTEPWTAWNEVRGPVGGDQVFAFNVTIDWRAFR